MDISKFPTDNLYKFLATFGLIISIASFFYPYMLENEMNKFIADITSDNDNMLQKLKEQNDWVEKLGKLVNDSKTIESLTDILKHLDIAKTKVEAISDELSQNRKQLNLFNEKINELKFWSVITRWSLFIGLTLMLLGFTFWYFKLQRYQDIIIKYEAKKIKMKS